MPYLTHDEIILLYPFGSPFNLALHNNPNWWNEIMNHNLPAPIRLKFDENIRGAMPLNIREGKGIYMFFIEPEHPFPLDVYIRHLLYVGRVQQGQTDYNFFKRFYSYVKAIGDKTTARNIMRLTNLWPDQTYVYYFDMSNRSDDDIKIIERNIFNKIVPPLNQELHGEARLTRQLY